MKTKENIYNVLREMNFCIFVFNLIFTCFDFNFGDDKNELNFGDDKNELNSRELSAHEMISPSPKNNAFPDYSPKVQGLKW